MEFIVNLSLAYRLVVTSSLLINIAYVILGTSEWRAPSSWGGDTSEEGWPIIISFHWTCVQSECAGPRSTRWTGQEEPARIQCRYWTVTNQNALYRVFFVNFCRKRNLTTTICKPLIEGPWNRSITPQIIRIELNQDSPRRKWIGRYAIQSDYVHIGGKTLYILY